MRPPVHLAWSHDHDESQDVQSTEPLRHGAYVCLTVPPGATGAASAAPVSELADRLRLRNEFEAASSGYPSETIAYLRRVEASPGEVEDQPLLGAGAVVHVASGRPEPVAEFCDELARLLPSALKQRVLCGVVRPKLYTGLEMHNFAYAHWILQQPGPVMPLYHPGFKSAINMLRSHVRVTSHPALYAASRGSC